MLTMELNYQKRLCQACEQRGLALSSAQLEALTHYLTLLVRWRPHLNLTGLRDTERMLEVLIVESLDFLYGEFFPSGIRVLDLGTGAGVPGIPLAVCRPEVRFTLLDRSEKKITFLRHVVASLHVENCQPCCGTAEDLARRLPPAERFDVVVSRGVGSVVHLMRLTAPLLQPGGRLLLRKPQPASELQEVDLLWATQTWRSVETLPLLWCASPAWVLLSIVRGSRNQ
jgi:16S rRNA (guanine527-N7)-methyltransferase